MKENIIEILKETFFQYLKEKSIKDPEEISSLLRDLFDTITEELLKNQNIPQTYISSPNAIIEVLGDNGQMFRRYLELKYEENINGIRLKGEDLGGNYSEIVFLSNKSIEQIHSLRGKGEDHPNHE